jgi:Flp pilus assembly CpaE family ATPase
MRTFLEEGSTEKVRLVLNRYKKIPGFTDDDVEKATDTKLLWKIPNNFQAIAPAIDKGIPVAFSDSQEIGRSFQALAATLAGAASNADGGLTLTPQSSKASSRFLSPLRAER